MSPEVAVSSEWRKMLDSAYVKQQLVLVAVDEAHCIPEWLVCRVKMSFLVNAVFPCVNNLIYRGVEFRKAFRRIGELRALVNVPFMALTASAPPSVQSNIIHTLHLTSPEIVSCCIDRPNIYLSVSPVCSLHVS